MCEKDSSIAVKKRNQSDLQVEQNRWNWRMKGFREELVIQNILFLYSCFYMHKISIVMNTSRCGSKNLKFFHSEALL